MVVKLAENGIPRSSLHRHVQRLEKKDQLLISPDEGTIMTIAERGTGVVRVIKTSASASILAAMIAQNRPAITIS